MMSCPASLRVRGGQWNACEVLAWLPLETLLLGARHCKSPFTLSPFPSAAASYSDVLERTPAGLWHKEMIFRWKPLAKEGEEEESSLPTGGAAADHSIHFMLKGKIEKSPSSFESLSFLISDFGNQNMSYVWLFQKRLISLESLCENTCLCIFWLNKVCDLKG